MAHNRLWLHIDVKNGIPPLQATTQHTQSRARIGPRPGNHDYFEHMYD